jgi:cell division protease FtsH
VFTRQAQDVVGFAKDVAYTSSAAEVGLVHLLAALVKEQESLELLSEAVGASAAKLTTTVNPPAEVNRCPGKMPTAASLRSVFETARAFSAEVPDRSDPGLVNLRHLVCAVAASRDCCTILNVTALARTDAAALLSAWHERLSYAPSVVELSERLRRMRSELLAKVFGQDHAVHAFVEGMFNAEVVAAADAKRRSPRAVFVFAGPPGVGKTYLAELGAGLIERPFKRFDMSAFSGHQQNEALVGLAKVYQGAHPGTLTEFVERHPDAVLLFDEIEKAHTNTIHLFLQVLDAGTLEDKYHERNVDFRSTTIIFTTNAGRRLYERPNESGVNALNTNFHRQTILDALENEKDTVTRQPYFPAAICSRLSAGYPVLFNYLRVNELERVVRAELQRIAALFQKQYYKRVSFDDLLPMCLVAREGARGDARTLRAQAEIFMKGELFRFCQLLEAETLEEMFRRLDSIGFSVDRDSLKTTGDVQRLFERADDATVLFVGRPQLARLYARHVAGVRWLAAASIDEALQVLANEETDVVLLDLLADTAVSTPEAEAPGGPLVLSPGWGQEFLRRVHERLPGTSVYLLGDSGGSDDTLSGGGLPDELFMACVRGGGARGLVRSRFFDDTAAGWEQRRDEFSRQLTDVCRGTYREKAASRLGQERKVLSFDVVATAERDGRSVTMVARDFRLARAVAAADVGEVLEDVERPTVRFDDVIGADAAKDELQFFIDYLKRPKRYAALGLKAPKGVLLYGPSGTGKTMLARATAGESSVAFIAATASSFVTIWQGSGPQNVRDLFARARRYAPAIVFIDEIDAIGKSRTGGVGAGRTTEETLNALLTEMDGFTSPSPDRPVFVLAATNFGVEADDRDAGSGSYRTLDQALVRRFSRAILVDLPERSAREKYLVRRLAGQIAAGLSESTVKMIAERASGMSIAGLEAVIEAAVRQAAKTDGGLTSRLLEDSFETMVFGEARAADPKTLLRTARHEAGHTVMYWLAGWIPTYVTIVSRGHHGGYMAPCAAERERRGIRTRDELLAGIRTNLGGRAAEMIFYGAAGGLSTGSSRDLEDATNTARAMICSFGMDEEFGIIATPELLKYESALGSPVHLRLNRAANKILTAQMLETVDQLTRHRGKLDAVAAALKEKERLSTQDLEALLGDTR